MTPPLLLALHGLLVLSSPQTGFPQEGQHSGTQALKLACELARCTEYRQQYYILIIKLTRRLDLSYARRKEQ